MFNTTYDLSATTVLESRAPKSSNHGGREGHYTCMYQHGCPLANHNLARATVE